MPRIMARRRRLVDAFGGKCQMCGYDRCRRALQFHHLDASFKKDYAGSQSGKVNSAEVEQHPERFKLLCANCHFEAHDAIDEATKPTYPCLQCGKLFRIQNYRLKDGRDKFCCKACMTTHQTGRDRSTLEERFFKYVSKEDSGCWIWVGAYIRGVTGMLNVRQADGKHRPMSVNQVSYLLHHGRKPPWKLGHSCNDTRCVNPDHLIRYRKKKAILRSTQRHLFTRE